MTRTFQEMADEAMRERYRLINEDKDPYLSEFAVTTAELKLMRKEPFGGNRAHSGYTGRLCGLKLVLKQ